MNNPLFWCLFIYLLPSLIARNNKYKHEGAVFVLNVVLGWTLIGWVIVLAWAYSTDASG